MRELDKLGGIWVGPTNKETRSRFLVIVPVEHEGESLAAWAELFSVNDEDAERFLPAGRPPGKIDLLPDEVLRNIVRSLVLGPANPHPGYCTTCGLLKVNMGGPVNELVITPYYDGQRIAAVTTRQPYRLEGDELILLPTGDGDWWVQPYSICMRRPAVR